MDIFKEYSKQTMKDYLSKYMEKLPEPPFFYLNRKPATTDHQTRKDETINENNRDQISEELMNFYRMAGDLNPFTYYSKLWFVMERMNSDENIQSVDILFRLISDRCFYFYEHRRYACSNGGLHTVIELKREQEFRKELNSPDSELVQEFEPMTKTHWEYYQEYLENYRKLNRALKRREQFIKVSGSLLKELNQLGRKTKVPIDEQDKTEEAYPIIGIRKESIIIAIAQKYVTSVIWKTRKGAYIEQFQQVFINKKQDAVKSFEKS